MKLKRYEVLWDVEPKRDFLFAFRKLGSDRDMRARPAALELIERRKERPWKRTRPPQDPFVNLYKTAGSIHAWLTENGMNPCYHGPDSRWSCLLDEDQAMAFKLRWL